MAIRLLLEYTETKYEDKMMRCGPAPDYDKTCWHSVKHTLGLDFPNLPYYVDGDCKITQSNAIMRYIARKHDMLGKTEEERVRVDMMGEQSMDFRNGMVRLAYNPNFDQMKGPYLEALPEKLDAFQNFLGSKPWFAGDALTFVDFIMYELLDQHRELDKTLCAKYTKLMEFLDRFEKLPKIEAYMKSGRFMKAPINTRWPSLEQHKQRAKRTFAHAHYI